MTSSARQPGTARRLGLALALLLGSLGGGACEPPQPPGAPADSTAVYLYRAAHAPGGTGKVYMGREIASMTDHDEARWLDRPEREVTEFPNRVVQALELRLTDVVADIGAGTGYFTFRLSPRVPQGRVLAVDIQPAMLDRIRARMATEGVSNIEPILGTEEDPGLPPGAVDVALIVVSYHEFSHPREMMARVVEALKPGGRLVLVEYRGEDPTLQVPPLHKMTQAQARREMEAVGLVWIQTKDVLPQQHFMVFEKPTAQAPAGRDVDSLMERVVPLAAGS